MDNIREKLVELLDEVLDECELVCERSNCPHFPLPSCVSTKQAYHLIANGVTVQEWIPVSEPPKENGRYNVYIADKVHACVDAVRFYKYGVGSLHKNVWARYDCEDGYYEVKNITHWMPLPTPPKGE